MKMIFLLIYDEIAPRSIRLRTNYAIAPGDNFKNNFGDNQKIGRLFANIQILCLIKYTMHCNMFSLGFG